MSFQKQDYASGAPRYRFTKPEMIFTRFKAEKTKTGFAATSQLCGTAAKPARTMYIPVRSSLGILDAQLYSSSISLSTAWQ